MIIILLSEVPSELLWNIGGSYLNNKMYVKVDLFISKEFYSTKNKPLMEVATFVLLCEPMIVLFNG